MKKQDHQSPPRRKAKAVVRRTTTKRSSTNNPSRKSSSLNADRTQGSSPAEPSTPSTFTSSGQDVEDVEAVEGTVRKAQHHWKMEAGLDKNFFLTGKLLSQLPLQLFQHPDGGLILVEDGRPRHITTAEALAPLLIDNIRITVKKNNEYHGERVPDPVLNNMLASRTFLQHFRRVEDVVTTPIVLPDFTPTKPGFNDQGGVL